MVSAVGSLARLGWFAFADDAGIGAEWSGLDNAGSAEETAWDY